MKRKIPACVLMAAAAVLIAVGLSQGDAAQVMAKAIRICMECVGIG